MSLRRIETKMFVNVDGQWRRVPYVLFPEKRCCVVKLGNEYGLWEPFNKVFLSRELTEAKLKEYGWPVPFSRS